MSKRLQGIRLAAAVSARAGLIVCGVFLAAVGLLPSRLVFAFTEPLEAPPGGSSAAPLNVSSTLQTKTGKLILEGGFEVRNIGSAVFGVPVQLNGSLNLPDTNQAVEARGKVNIADPIPATGALNVASAALPKDICWNGVCKSDWPVSTALRATTPQVSFVVDTPAWNSDYDGPGAMTVQAATDWAVGGAARDVPDDPILGVQFYSTGIYGVSAANAARSGHSLQTESSGVMGEARRDDNHFIGILGRSFVGSNALAGYFQGRLVVNQQEAGREVSNKGGSHDAVGIYGNSATPPGTPVGSALYVEQGNAGAYAGYFSGQVNVQGSLCISGDCKSAWPAVATNYFSRNTTDKILYPTDSLYHFGVGGTTYDSNKVVLNAANNGLIEVGPTPPGGRKGKFLFEGALNDGESRHFSLVPAARAAVTDGATDRLYVTQGVITVDYRSFNPISDTMELGYQGRDIVSTGSLYLRPGGISASSGVSLSNAGGLAKITTPLLTSRTIIEQNDAGANDHKVASAAVPTSGQSCESSCQAKQSKPCLLALNATRNSTNPLSEYSCNAIDSNIKLCICGDLTP